MNPTSIDFIRDARNRGYYLPVLDRRLLIYMVFFFLFCVFWFFFGLTGCETVEFYQKQHLVDPIMVFDPDSTEVHFGQKVHYSREGSVGGIGTGAGGGCGCY